jgi:hypothetical protein
MQGGPDGRVSEKRRIAQFVPHFFNLSGAVSHIWLDFTNVLPKRFFKLLVRRVRNTRNKPALSWR